MILEELLANYQIFPPEVAAQVCFRCLIISFLHISHSTLPCCGQWASKWETAYGIFSSIFILLEKLLMLTVTYLYSPTATALVLSAQNSVITLITPFCIPTLPSSRGTFWNQKNSTGTYNWEWVISRNIHHPDVQSYPFT